LLILGGIAKAIAGVPAFESNIKQLRWEDYTMNKRILLGLIAVAFLVAQPAAADSLYNIDLQPSGTAVYSGIQPNSAAADPVFNQGSIWNAFEVNWPGTLSVNPSLSSLKDSSGNVTSAGFSMTGNVEGYASGSDPLLYDFIFLDPNFGTNTSAQWEFTGVQPGAPFKMYIHPFPYDPGYPRSFYITVDSNGDGSLADEIPQYVSDTGGGVLFSGNVSSSGTVLGNWQMPTPYYGYGQASWAGVQLYVASVPEPATMLLLGFGLMGLAGVRRKLS